MPSIGAVWLGLDLDGNQLVTSAKREGKKAGETAGTAMSASMKASISAKGLFAAGFGLELGKQGLVALENAIGRVINAIPDAIQSGQAFGLVVDEIVDKTGASAESVSQFAGTLQYLGINTSGLSSSLRVLSTEIAANEAKFTKLGIQTRDSNGNLLDTITILDNVRTYLAGAGDGATKMALASDLLGRSSGELIDFLNLTDEQAQALRGTMDDLGVTMDTVAVKNAESLMRETNLLNLAFQGFSNMLFTEVAPTVRNVIGGITEFIKTHGAEIRETIVSMTQAVLGFVTGLLGMQGIAPFQSQLDGLASSGGDVTLSMEQWAQQTGRTIPAVDKATTSTKAGTGAIDDQIKSTEKLIERSKARDDASETIFQRTMKRLAGEYVARLATMDLAERELEIDRRKTDLADQLADAQKALQKAQTFKLGSTIDPKEVADAAARVRDIQSEQAEMERVLANDSTRARLQAVQDYIEGVEKITSESENKQALAKTLALRNTKLTGRLEVAVAAGNADEIADITAQLEAVKTAEAQTQTAIREGAKQSELEALKAQLQEQRSAISASRTEVTGDNAKHLVDLKTQYDTYLAEQTTATSDHVGLIEARFMGDPAAGTGLGGSLSKAFGDGAKAGETFRLFIVNDLIPAFKDVADVVGEIAAMLGEIAKHGDLLSTIFDAVKSGGIDLHVPTPGDIEKINAATQQYVIEYKAENAGKAPSEAQVRQYLKDQGFEGFAKGAWDVPSDMIGGLHKGEMVVPRQFADVFRAPTIPSMAAMAGVTSDGGSPAIIRVEVGGNRLLDYIDQGLYWRRR